MRIQSTQNSNKSAAPEYIKAGAIGALTGYALKYALPLTNGEEADTFTKTTISEIEKRAENTKNNKLENIMKKTLANEQSLDKNLADVINKNKNMVINGETENIIREMGLTNVAPNVQAQVLKIMHCVENEGNKAIEKSKAAMRSVAKANRPAFYFASIGAIIGLSYQVLKQSLTPELEFISDDNRKIYF